VALEMSITPLNLEDREEFTIVFTELTERQLQNRLKQEFISTVSHELRTPLTSIRGAVGLIASGAVGTIPKSASDLAVVANKNCERMTLIINDILDLEKIEAGRLEIRVRPINVSDFLDQAIDANAPYAGQFDVTFLKQEMDHDLEVAADPDRLMQVLSNLLSNAAKFSHDGGTVTIGAIADVGSVHIFVRDEGIGISDTFKDKIFENISRADNLDTRHVAGTGLGLSISKKLVEATHGTINFDSEIGKGATFQIGFRRWTKMSSEPRSRPAGEREETANLGNGQTAQIN
jgi:signal transduction histidine kinase